MATDRVKVLLRLRSLTRNYLANLKSGEDPKKSFEIYGEVCDLISANQGVSLPAPTPEQKERISKSAKVADEMMRGMVASLADLVSVVDEMCVVAMAQGE